MKTSDAINELAAAMAQAQSEMKPAIKSSENPAFGRGRFYADLTSVWESIRGPLTSHGLTVWQDVTTEDRGISVSTRITHSTGQWVEFGPLTVPLSKQDAHGVGSAESYARRYALSAAVGVVAEEDDDGNAAVASKGKPQRDEARSIPREAPKASGVLKDQDGHEMTIANAPEDAPPEREVLLHDIKAMSDSLRLKPEQRSELWSSHCGPTKKETAPLEGLRTLKAELAKRCEAR